MKMLQIIILLVITNCLAQKEIDSVIAKKNSIFENHNITEFFYFEKYCTGRIRLTKISEIDCFIEDSKLYVFWKDNNRNFVQMLGNCESKAIEVPNDIISFFSRNKKQIEVEKVEHYKMKSDSWKSVSHSCFKKISFLQNSKLSSNRFDEFDLTSEKDESNVNFEKNNKLNLVLLANICEKLIEEKGI